MAGRNVYRMWKTWAVVNITPEVEKMMGGEVKGDCGERKKKKT